MTEKELELARHRMEVLRMARQLLNDEYINRRAEDHNKWLAEADQAWRNKGIKLPYPPFAPYPTEQQIIERAETLLKFVAVSGDSTEQQQTPVTEQKESATEESAVQEPAKEEISGTLFTTSSTASTERSSLSPFSMGTLGNNSTIKLKE